MNLQQNPTIEPDTKNCQEPVPRSCRLLAYVEQHDPRSLAMALEALLNGTDEGRAFIVLEVPGYFAKYDGNPAVACADHLNEYLLRMETFFRELHAASALKLESWR